ncbi:MAG TPA: hypothetical protein VF369_08715 [candidate division Zixibacteria bacterium]
MNQGGFKDKTFYEKCKSFVIGTFDLLSNYLGKGESIPNDIVQDISIESDSLWVYKYRFVPLLWHITYRHAKEIGNLRESIDLREYMVNNPILNKQINHMVGYAAMKTHVDADRILDSLLYQSFDEAKPFKFNADLFDSIYNKVEDLFYSKSIKFIVSATLQNFECEKEELCLSDDLRIVKMTPKEREDLWRGSRYSSWLPDNLIPFFKYRIQQKFEKPKYIEETPIDASKNVLNENPHDIARDKFNNVVTALRLFKSGIVGFSMVMTIPITWFPIGGGYSSRRGEHVQCDKYFLTEAETNNFEAFFTKFIMDKSASNTQSFIELALDRFNYAYDRKRPEDKLIDYMIAFETLYLKKEDEGEYGYRMSMRVASLLGKIPDERKQIFLDLKKAYRLRSKIVHGSKKIDNNKLISVHKVSKIEQHLRRSIQEFISLNRNRSHDEIIDSLDEILLS